MKNYCDINTHLCKSIGQDGAEIATECVNICEECEKYYAELDLTCDDLRKGMATLEAENERLQQIADEFQGTIDILRQNKTEMEETIQSQHRRLMMREVHGK